MVVGSWLAGSRGGAPRPPVVAGDAAAADGAGLLGGAADALRAAGAEPQPLRRGHGGRLPRLRALLPGRRHAVPPRPLAHPRRARARPPLKRPGRLRLRLRSDLIPLLLLPMHTNTPCMVRYCIQHVNTLYVLLLCFFFSSSCALSGRVVAQSME